MADEKEGAAVPRTAEAQPDELTDPTPFLDRLKGKPSRDSRIDAAAFLGERPTPTQHDLAHLLDMVKETRRERAQTREPQVAGASPAGSFGSRERGESSGGAGPITEAAARMAVRLARFEAFSEALEVLSSADCVNDAIARVAELRSAAKPAVPRPSKATPVCDDCSHPMAHWRDDLWQCAMTTCKSSGKVIHIPGLRTEGAKEPKASPGYDDATVGRLVTRMMQSESWTQAKLFLDRFLRLHHGAPLRTDGAPRACHICGTTTATHSSVCSAAGVPSTWDMGDESAGPNASTEPRKGG
jgi:hypothetical protein